MTWPRKLLRGRYLTPSPRPGGRGFFFKCWLFFFAWYGYTPRVEVFVFLTVHLGLRRGFLPPGARRQAGGVLILGGVDGRFARPRCESRSSGVRGASVIGFRLVSGRLSVGGEGRSISPIGPSGRFGSGFGAQVSRPRCRALRSCRLRARRVFGAKARGRTGRKAPHGARRSRAPSSAHSPADGFRPQRYAEVWSRATVRAECARHAAFCRPAARRGAPQPAAGP